MNDYFNVERTKQSYPELGHATTLVDLLSNLQLSSLDKVEMGPHFLGSTVESFIIVKMQKQVRCLSAKTKNL